MKKIAYLIMASAMVFAVSSCQDNNKLETHTTEEGLVDDNGTRLSPDQQKSKIEETADILLANTKLDVWKADYETAMIAAGSLSQKELNPEALNNRINEIMTLWYSQESESPETVYRITASLASITGHFTEQEDGTFAYEPANDLKITAFADGKAVVLTFSAKEREQAVFIDSSVYEEYDEYGNVVYSETENVYVKVPESAKLTISLDGKLMASLDIKLDYTDVDNDSAVSPADKLDLSYVLSVSEYTLNVSKLNYASDKASVSAKLSHGKQLLVGLDAKAAYSFSEGSQSGNVPFNPISADMTLDLAGKMQIVGTIPDYSKLQEIARKINESYNDEAAFKAAVAEFEKAYGFGIYYDGGNTLQAKLGIEPYKREESESWNMIPVIRFMDGTSYGLSDYFTEERFGNLAQKVLDWQKEIYDYLGLNPQGESAQ